MSSRPIASGTISFGLVAIPIKFYSPIDSSRSVRFNQIHAKCESRIKQQLYCPTCEETVARDELVKGYEFSKGQYVLFTGDELEGLLVKPTHAVEITEFVPLDQVDPIFFEKSYYLGPDKGGEKPYALLAQTLRETNRAALGQYAARGKQYLVLLRPFSEGLILQQLHYADEIRSFSDVPLGEAEPKSAEIELAKQLVEQTSTDQFLPNQFQDDTRGKLLQMIDQKIQGQEVSVVASEPPKAQVVDLLAALKASLASNDSSEDRKPPKRSPVSAEVTDEIAAEG
jgi:DNA end-binding protein Ku